jgi:hypothetical protein
MAYDAYLGREEPLMMRRITALMTLTLATVVLSAGAALADSTYPPTVVKGANGSRGTGDGTAFTGSAQLPFAMLMVAILVLVGVAALSAVFVARRRAARFAV